MSLDFSVELKNRKTDAQTITLSSAFNAPFYRHLLPREQQLALKGRTRRLLNSAPALCCKNVLLTC